MINRVITPAAVAVAAILCGFLSSQAAAATGQEEKRPSVDPEASRLLQQMVDSYARLTTYRQETEFTSQVSPVGQLPAPAPAPQAAEPQLRPRKSKEDPFAEQNLERRLRLSFAAPNRLRLESTDTDENGKLQVSVWVSDGKSFWTFNPEKNLFSREKAPGNIHDFAKLAHMTSGSLEVLMLMGINPFTRLEDEATAVHVGTKETLRGVETDVVVMNADLGPQLTETRLYIGAADHLLYRLVSATTAKPKLPDRLPGGGPLEELALSNAPPLPQPFEADEVPGPPGVPMKSRIVCDNLIDAEPRFDITSFTYTPPPDALYLTNPDPRRKPMTMKQRIAELNRSFKKQKKAPVKVYRY